MNVYEIIVDENVVETVAFINETPGSITDYIEDYYSEYNIEATYELVE